MAKKEHRIRRTALILELELLLDKLEIYKKHHINGSNEMKQIVHSRLGGCLSHATHRKEFITNYISENALHIKLNKMHGITREHAYGVTRAAEVILSKYIKNKIKNTDDLLKYLKMYCFQNITTRKENQILRKTYEIHPELDWREIYKLSNVKICYVTNFRKKQLLNYKILEYKNIKKYPLS